MKSTIKESDKSSDTLLRFLKEHQKWSRWLGTEQEGLHKNTIWHQCIEMVDNHFCYIGLNEAGYQTSKLDNHKEYFSINGPLASFIQQSYVNFQCLAIRRLTDTRDNIHSLARLLERLEKNSFLINREVFVRFLGYPYEYKKDLEEHDKRIMEEVINSKDGTTFSEIPKARHSKNRHHRFDILSNTKPEERRPDDTVLPSYWQNLKNKLQIPEIIQIRSFADKYLAHAADEKSARKLEDEARTLSVKKIETCHKAILEVFHRLSLDFWFTTLSVQPTSAYNIGYLMDKPFTNSETKEKIGDYLQNKEDEYLAAQNMTISRPARRKNKT